ncbi:unnamed protein product [Caenorhabditis auriculariae]|uniref:Uncharacterized protein n=1 Tax=Caenorhabditis auriculariae TaxID=2777116 RepID=A0A8S1H9G9_9PELO|nr:unnamed protein product [Caenorhabditis auriculariae]
MLELLVGKADDVTQSLTCPGRPLFPFGAVPASRPGTSKTNNPQKKPHNAQSFLFWWYGRCWSVRIAPSEWQKWW